VRRFWDKVDKSSGDCWIWTAHKRGHGYGGFQVNGKTTTAHRVSWQLHNGDIPHELCVLHKCDNRLCVNPSHLFLGTQIENIKDRDSKGRQFAHKGSKHGNALLTEDQVRVIKRNKGFTSPKFLGKCFGVSFQTIQAINSGLAGS
jgi:hypothetical protein